MDRSQRTADGPQISGERVAVAGTVAQRTGDSGRARVVHSACVLVLRSREPAHSHVMAEHTPAQRSRQRGHRESSQDGFCKCNAACNVATATPTLLGRGCRHQGDLEIHQGGSREGRTILRSSALSMARSCSPLTDADSLSLSPQAPARTTHQNGRASTSTAEGESVATATTAAAARVDSSFMDLS